MLRTIALDKQRLVAHLQHSQQSNIQLAHQMHQDRSDFQEKINEMQQEINKIRNSVVDTKVIKIFTNLFMFLNI